MNNPAGERGNRGALSLLIAWQPGSVTVPKHDVKGVFSSSRRFFVDHLFCLSGAY